MSPVAISETDLEALLWVDVYKSGRLADRFPDDPLSLGKKLNYFSGAPESANDLKTTGKVRLRGEKLQREAFLMPRNLATIHLRRPCLDMPPVSRGETCAACLSGGVCTDGPTLKYVGEENWTALEGEEVADLDSRIQAVFLRWEDAHYLVRRPPFLFSGSEGGDSAWTAKPGQDTWAAYLLPPGIAKAKAFVESKDAPSWVRAVLDDNRRSSLWAMTPEQRANAPEWQQKEFREEGGTVDPTLVRSVEPSSLAVACSRCECFHPVATPCHPVALERLRRRRPGLLTRFLDKMRGVKKGRR